MVLHELCEIDALWKSCEAYREFEQGAAGHRVFCQIALIVVSPSVELCPTFVKGTNHKPTIACKVERAHCLAQHRLGRHV
jgi:hypothetical protein